MNARMTRKIQLLLIVLGTALLNNSCNSVEAACRLEFLGVGSATMEPSINENTDEAEGEVEPAGVISAFMVLP